MGVGQFGNRDFTAGVFIRRPNYLYLASAWLGENSIQPWQHPCRESCGLASLHAPRYLASRTDTTAGPRRSGFWVIPSVQLSLSELAKVRKSKKSIMFVIEKHIKRRIRVWSAVLFKIKGANKSDLLLRVALVPLFCLIVSTAVAHLSSGNDYWEAARITPSLAMAYGLPVYSSWDQGSIQTGMYPPFWVIAYLPVAFGKSPVATLTIACMITQALFFGPVLISFLQATRDKIIAFIAFSIFVFLANLIPSLNYSAFRPHADAPSLGLSLLACSVMLKHSKEKKWFLICMSCMLAWLSVWSKQVMMPLLVALPFWMLLISGVHSFVRVCIILLVEGAFLLVVFIKYFFCRRYDS